MKESKKKSMKESTTINKKTKKKLFEEGASLPPGETYDDVDESFEIISEKEKYWRDQLLEAETNLFKSEGNVLVNKMLIKIADEEVKKEAKKNES